MRILQSRILSLPQRLALLTWYICRELLKKFVTTSFQASRRGPDPQQPYCTGVVRVQIVKHLFKVQG